MTIFDRYLLFLFLKTFLVCFVSFTGLFVVGHLFSNLDEMQAIAETEGWLGTFQVFYLPRVAAMFDKTAGILTLAAAIFSISLMQRRREMTAVEAAGITKARILRPVFLSAVVVVALTIANREMLIPKYKSSLVRTPQTWNDQTELDMTTQEDETSGVVLRGNKLYVSERRISDVEVQLPAPVNQVLSRIEAGWAILEPENEWHPEGIWLHQLKTDEVSQLESLSDKNGKPAFLSPKDNKWLIDSQCFVACHFDMEQMAYGDKLKQYQTTPEMMADLRKPRRWYGQRQEVDVHSRLIRPVLDMTLLLLGLPLVIGGIERNVFVSAGVCFGIVAVMSLTIMTCGALGATSLIRPAALAAWIPVAVFLPMAVVALRRLKR